MSAAYTLPLTATLAEQIAKRDRTPFPGQPTWARRINGAGQHQRVRLLDHGTLVLDTDAGPVLGPHVWVVPAAAMSPGDRVEVGPVPDGVRVVVEPVAVTERGGTRW